MSHSWNAVLFDIGGVILNTESIQRARELFVAGLSVNSDLETTEAIEIWDRELGEYFRERDGHSFRPAYEGYHRTAETVTGESVPVDRWLPLVTQAADVAFEPMEGTVETLERLTEEGYYLGVISDIDAWEAEFILTIFDIREYFDDVTTSSEVGRTKPAPEMFQTALEKSPTPPEHTLFVGDRYENDMEGGNRAGLRTVAFGGTAAAEASDDDSVVDFCIEEFRELLDIVGIE